MAAFQHLTAQIQITGRIVLLVAGLWLFAVPLPIDAQGSSSINTAPRYALIIGNSKYQETPLRNPYNDAQALAAELQKLGFSVQLKLDAGRNEMLEAIRTYSNELAKNKGVGLFYYAGHGAQLGWRNYLIPVDAVIEKLEDMPGRTVELSTLLDGLMKAKNRLNVIILDACRDNPFGSRVQTEQKGLSQFDAPPGSLLAYATSPGNVASDGTGANGLYTEHLVREMRVPESKLEDVLKRVRLNVRLRSDGQQIPWETTSLEEDFYFRPPKQTKKLSVEEAEKQFEQELALWDQIKASKDPLPLEDYLRKYPSGRFSEIAQFRLDKLLAERGEKKIQIASIAPNPFSQGTGRIETSTFKTGDRFQYRAIDLYTKLETRSFTNTVSDVTDTEVIFNRGRLITDFLGNLIRRPDGAEYSQAQLYIAEYAVGKKWTTRFRIRAAAHQAWTDTEYSFVVASRDKVTVPAGTFDAYRVEGRGTNFQSGNQMELVYWIAPQVKRFIATEMRRTSVAGKVLTYEREELTAYLQH